MRTLRFFYMMQMSFEFPAVDHHFTLRCFPPSDAWQKITGENVEISPNKFISSQTDSFSNRCVYGTSSSPHNQFSVEVGGVAEVYGTNPLSSGDENESPFRYPTSLTQCGKNLCDFYEKTSSSSFQNLSNFQKAEFLMNSLSENFSYVPGVTGVNTSAEEAFCLGRGVCQDYAHILLALCRKSRIPCKYVAGMMIGEGATHAWTEVFEDGKWLLLDPTHNRRCDDSYIVFSRGRDARDCSINQGVFTGGGRQTQKIRVFVEEIRR